MQKTEEGNYVGITTWSSFSHIPAGETKLELAFVEPSMIYEVEMYAENSIGRSPKSDLIFATSPGKKDGLECHFTVERMLDARNLV
jgi:hypothetical protein